MNQPQSRGVWAPVVRAVLAVAVIAAVSMGGGAGASSASSVQRGGDTVSTPLTVVHPLEGACRTPHVKVKWHKVAADDAANRENWWLAISTQDQTGTFRVATWIKNSYTKFTTRRICKSDHTRVRIMQPRVYVHKIRTVRYHCDPNCVPLLPAPVSTSGWKPKYCSSTGTEIICLSY